MERTRRLHRRASFPLPRASAARPRICRQPRSPEALGSRRHRFPKQASLRVSLLRPSAGRPPRSVPLNRLRIPLDSRHGRRRINRRSSCRIRLRRVMTTRMRPRRRQVFSLHALRAPCRTLLPHRLRARPDVPQVLRVKPDRRLSKRHRDQGHGAQRRWIRDCGMSEHALRGPESMAKRAIPRHRHISPEGREAWVPHRQTWSAHGLIAAFADCSSPSR